METNIDNKDLYKKFYMDYEYEWKGTMPSEELSKFAVIYAFDSLIVNSVKNKDFNVIYGSVTPSELKLFDVVLLRDNALCKFIDFGVVSSFNKVYETCTVSAIVRNEDNWRKDKIVEYTFNIDS